MISTLSNWWQGRTSREQWIVIIAVFSIGYALLDSVVITPVLTLRESLRTDVQTKSKDLQWLQQIVAQKQASADHATNDPTATGALVVAIDNTARQYQLGNFLEDNKSAGANSARVSLKQAPFGLTLNWLQALAQQNIHITQASIKTGKQAGLVDVRLTLERA